MFLLYIMALYVVLVHLQYNVVYVGTYSYNVVAGLNVLSRTEWSIINQCLKLCRVA